MRTDHEGRWKGRKGRENDERDVEMAITHNTRDKWCR